MSGLPRETQAILEKTPNGPMQKAISFLLFSLSRFLSIVERKDFEIVAKVSCLACNLCRIDKIRRVSYDPFKHRRSRCVIEEVLRGDYFCRDRKPSQEPNSTSYH